MEPELGPCQTGPQSALTEELVWASTLKATGGVMTPSSSCVAAGGHGELHMLSVTSPAVCRRAPAVAASRDRTRICSAIGRASQHRTGLQRGPLPRQERRLALLAFGADGGQRWRGRAHTCRPKRLTGGAGAQHSAVVSSSGPGLGTRRACVNRHRGELLQRSPLHRRRHSPPGRLEASRSVAQRARRPGLRGKNLAVPAS